MSRRNLLTIFSSRKVLPPLSGAFLCLGLIQPSLISMAAEGLSPQEALKAFETEPGFAVELVAAEPLVIDPVALAFEDATHLYIAENRDYPVGSSDGQPQGRIALLIDTDHDGVMDQRRNFVTGLSFPNGVMCWKGGVIVTAAPDVWYFKDTNSDGVADVRERWLTGFSLGGSSQLRVNDPTLGPDGWIYFAGGLSAGRVSVVTKPDRVIDLARADLRLNPETMEIEPTVGKSQFGLSFDDAGERFACMNRVHVQHAPIASRYLQRNPDVEVSGVLQACPEIVENRLMTRYSAGAARIFPISANVTTADSHAGTYSAACAVHVYRGEQLPEEYRAAVFTCDPTGNLVRGDRLVKRGGTYGAVRIHDGTEALRSRDNWFRPVFLADGPDGALYIADMYRKTIEHPEYLPEALRKHTDFVSGKTEGRIWRLRAAQRPAASPAPFPKDPPTNLTEAVRLLDSAIPWSRDRAWRWMVEQGGSVRGQIISLAPDAWGWKGQWARLELCSRWNALTAENCLAALSDSYPESRRRGVKHCEQLWKQSLDHQTLTKVVELGRDDDPHVRFQVVLSLGEILSRPDCNEDMRDRALLALSEVARVQADDPWTRAAIQSSLVLPAFAERFLTTLLKSSNGQATSGSKPSDEKLDTGRLALIETLSRQLGRGFAGTGSNLEATLKGWHLRAQGTHLREQAAVLLGWVSGSGLESEPDIQKLNALWPEPFQWALRGADEDKSLDAARALAIRLLGWVVTGDRATALDRLEGLLSPKMAGDVQAMAARSMIRPWNIDRASKWLGSSRWNEYGPATRSVMIQSVMSRSEWVVAMLTLMEKGQMPMNVLSSMQREQLLKSKDAQVRERAEKAFANGGGAGDRKKALEGARAALGLKPTPAHGHEVFLKQCAGCHRFNREGVAVGPDLFDIRNQPKETILLHVVIPEYEIAPNFVNYACETRDGRQYYGLLAGETSGMVTLKQAQGVEERIARDQIVKWEASSLSLMPQEFEKVIPPQDMADLLAYLKGE